MSIYDVESCPALKGIKVLDLGQSAVAQLITKYLADHGATAIWIESMTHVDITRASHPHFGGIVHPNRAAASAASLTSRFSFGVNIRRPEGAAVVKKLAAWADIIVYSYPQGVMEARGLGHEQLRQVNPNAIVVTGSGLGGTGPYAVYRGFGWALKGLAGVIEYTGWPDRPGVGTPQPYTDYCSPWIATAGVLAALERRRRTGKGAHIDFSHLEASLSFVPSHLILQYTANKEIPGRRGNRSPDAAPCGAYPCLGHDRWCVISVGTDAEWQGLVRVIGLPWAKARRLASFPGRKENEDELDALLAGWTVSFDPHGLMEKLQGAGVPAGVVQSYAEVMEKDPQIRHRGFLVKLSRPELENVSHLGWPGQLSRTPAVMRPTPRLGEHTYAVCKEVLGMPDEEFARLVSGGVLETT